MGSDGQKKPAEAGFGVGAIPSASHGVNAFTPPAFYTPTGTCCLAGNLGFEPRTSRLTAGRSTTELIAKFGQSGKTRTYDHKVPNLVRYQLRYALMPPSIPDGFLHVNL